MTAQSYTILYKNVLHTCCTRQNYLKLMDSVYFIADNQSQRFLVLCYCHSDIKDYWHTVYHKLCNLQFELSF